jgi:PAS domain-containing protein
VHDHDLLIHYSTRHFDFAVAGGAADVAAQPQLGLCPERRRRLDRRDLDYPPAIGAHLSSTPSLANVEVLHERRDWLQVTLSCIGDVVITTDGEGRVTFLNPVAESLTAWTQEAVGQSSTP